MPDISENEMSLQALGPNFALKVDNTFMDKVKVDLARCAVQLRNQENKENTDETILPTKSLHRSPFQIPFIRTPETASHETEDKLSQLNKFVIRTMKNAKIMGDLTHQQYMLEFILSNSFFSFDNKLYKQVDGLFMGLRPSPL